MGSMQGNNDVACFYVTKHSWKGKLKRVFSIGTHGIATYNPATYEPTNKWSYDAFISIVPNSKESGEFVISVKKGKKVDTMRFTSEHRADILTEALKFRHLFAESSPQSLKFHVYKHHWSETKLPVVLEVTEASLNQLDPTTNRLLACYDYKDMEAILLVSDYHGAFAVKHGGFGRLHIFISDRRDDIVKHVCDSAFNYIGVTVRPRKDQLTIEECVDSRFGKFSNDESVMSLTEFTVQKICTRHKDPMRRILALSETCLVERDPGTYCIATCKPLCEILSFVRSQDNPQLFDIELMNGHVRSYISSNRDALLATLIDGVRASGNADVHVKMAQTCRGYRLGPFSVPVGEEVESLFLKYLHQSPASWLYCDTIRRFNANMPYSGLLHAVSQDGLFSENKEKLIHTAINCILDKEGNQALLTNEELECQFHALRRLVSTKAGFAAFTQLLKFRERLGVKVLTALKRNDVGTSYGAIDTICALMEPMHVAYDLRQQQLNKTSILSNETFLQSLLEMFVSHVTHGSGSLIVAAMLDFLNYALCAPYSETTDGNHFDKLLEMVAKRARSIFKLFEHPSLAVVKGAGLVMKAIIEEGETEVSAEMQVLALSEGVLLRHLHTSLFTSSSDSRLLANRQLSRHLLGLWVTGHPTAMGLLKRLMPSELLAFLQSDEKVPEKCLDLINIRDNLKLAQDHSVRLRRNPHWKLIEKHVEDVFRHWRTKIGKDRKDEHVMERPVVLRKRRERVKSDANWQLFYYKFNQDHAKANLIWNFKTREELREALEEEIRAFNTDRDLCTSDTMSWNYQEFEVPYNCIADEVKIGEYYLRLLLEEENVPSVSSTVKHSYEFFNDLYHRFLLTSNVTMKCMCLQAMAIVYGRHYEDIGVFNDTKYMIHMLNKCFDKLERDRLLLFINKLILNRRNVKELIDANGLKTLVDLLPLAHLHVSRATVPTQTNVIEADPNCKRDSEKEWFYGNSDKERLGPFSFEEIKEFWSSGQINASTKCWAQGMDGWQCLSTVPQLKWTLVCENMSILNESELAILVIEMLIKICEYYPSRDSSDAIVRPLPRAKRLLSDTLCLPHIVQLLLTFEPTLVEKVSILLHMIMQDNPMISKLFLTGVFYFILMYTGSNILPIARLLQYTHIKQAFHFEECLSTDIINRSVLGQILPEAMICYLENYGAKKFAVSFLGEFDTPEVIWSNEMRRMMIQKLAAHVSDFTPRIFSNIRALYQYCPIPAIRYPQLDYELFCNMYYLRHLCDKQKFADWPIKDPVDLLKHVLDAWRKEVEKKPTSMSVCDAFEVLGLDPNETHEEAVVRKAYFRLAQQYHPDKNPDGRDMFEKVNKAYEFLCLRSVRAVDGPDPVNIVLTLKTQSILFQRYCNALQPYKYSGYPLLVKTIKIETDDDQLFSKESCVLDPATELAYRTVNCSALNAEELRRENGLQILQQAFTRCVSVLNSSSKMNDVAVLVSTNVVLCLAIASQFTACRERMLEMPQFVNDLCRILYYKHLPDFCCTAVQCISALAVDPVLQQRMFEAGVLWHVLLFFFKYDYTLEEGGVDGCTESNWQSALNNLAILGVHACARLGGYLSDENASPVNNNVRKSLEAMLTPYTARMFSSGTPFEILKILNCNTENPYLVWNNASRAELLEFLEHQQTTTIKSGECDQSYGAEFVYSIHKTELIIDDVFVRVYNEQPMFPIENPKRFVASILEFLNGEAQFIHSMKSLANSNLPLTSSDVRVRNAEMALTALKNVIKNNAGVEVQCIGQFKLLFSLLQLDGYGKLQTLTLDVISNVTCSNECIKDIAASVVMPYLLLVTTSLPQERPKVLDILYSLMSSTLIVKECFTSGAVIYLLDFYCNATDLSVREKTAVLLSKMTVDKLVGPKVRILLMKFLPPIFVDAMRDSPEASIHMFEGKQENPELIWDDIVKKKVCNVVADLKHSHVEAQRLNSLVAWKVPNDLSTMYADVKNEVVICGVYLRLFLANPTWVLHRPKEFLEDLLTTCLDLMNREVADNELLEMVTMSIVSLIQAQPNLAELIPNQGHIPRMLQAVGSRNSAVPKCCLLILHQLSHNKLCIQSLAECECMSFIKDAMVARTDMLALACEMLYYIFESQLDELVLQALNTDLVRHLLALLNGGLENVENPSSAKAHIVKALKSASKSQQYGDQVNNILESATVWKEYKDQKHDLFITTATTAGYLTGTTPGFAGYLMQGTTQSMPTVPPPLNSEDVSTS